jgi:hypothetical protein
VPPTVFGLVVFHPYTGAYKAVAAIDTDPDTGRTVFPPHPDTRNPRSGDYPSMNGFRSKREAATWLLGVASARADWFREAVRMARTGDLFGEQA